MSDIRKTIQKLDEMTAGATGAGSIAGNGLGFTSGGIGEKPQKRVKEDESIRIDKASNFGEWANTPQKTAKQHRVKDMKVVEGKKKEPEEADYGDDYQAMVKRVGAKAKQQAAKKAKKPVSESSQQVAKGVTEGEVVAFPKKHKGDLDSVDSCVKCDGDLQGGTYMGHRVKVCIPCKQVYLPPNSGIDQKGNKIKEGANDLPQDTLDLIDEYIAKVEPGADRNQMIRDVVAGLIHTSELEYALQDDVMEAGNKPLEKSPLGMGDDSTPRELKSKMSGASDEHVKSQAAKKITALHSKIAKMQQKLAKSELRRRSTNQTLDEAELSEEQLVKDLFKQLDLFKHGKDRELGKKPGDREIQAKESADGVAPATKMVLEKDKLGSDDNPFNAKPVDIEDLITTEAVNPHNYDSDEDYRAALAAEKKPKLRSEPPTRPSLHPEDTDFMDPIERRLRADQERVKAGWAAWKAAQQNEKK